MNLQIRSDFFEKFSLHSPQVFSKFIAYFMAVEFDCQSYTFDEFVNILNENNLSEFKSAELFDNYNDFM